LPIADGVEFLFGCETEMDKLFTVGVSTERYDEFDFVIIPTTHLHMTGFTLSEEDAKSDDRRAQLWVERFERLLDMPLPFHKIGIAHLACPLISPRDRSAYLAVLDMISDGDMERIFTRAAERGCGIEINSFDMKFADGEADSVLRMFRIAKKCGCKFYFGSDAHHPAALDEAKQIFERAADLLGLEESDKFVIN
jgi:histidinol phosphatase-like PHP family hydrolase